MKYVDGDLISLAKMGVFDVIVHGCNCYNTMGAGIAKQISRSFPAAFYVDQKTTRGDVAKLGTITTAVTESCIVVNAYTQFEYWNEKDVDYNAIKSCMKIIKNMYTSKKIGMPKIGSGLAGGDWEKVSKIIKKELKNEDVTIVNYIKVK